VVIPNIARGVDGRWSALDTAALYPEATRASYLYQAVLRDALTRTLGVEWSAVERGIAEIDDVPRAVLLTFSKRHPVSAHLVPGPAWVPRRSHPRVPPLDRPSAQFRGVPQQLRRAFNRTRANSRYRGGHPPPSPRRSDIRTK